MTCFWDGLIRGLGYDEINKVLSIDNINPHTFSEALKKHNLITENVRWNGEDLIENQLKENFDSIEDFDLNTVIQGYLCSTFDPFIFLVCELFELKIIHRYVNVNLEYSVSNPKRILNFVSSRSHFVFKG